MARTRYLLVIFSFVIIVGCQKVPDYVIQPDDMAELMADIHIGEAVVEANYADFPSDSARMLMKQSILARHGYSLAQLDTSFMWYGAHLDVYRDVYEKTVKIIESRIAESGSVEVMARKAEFSGDSVNVWPGTSRYILRAGSPSRFLTFAVDRDGDWKDGDMYTIRAKFEHAPSGVRWTMMADYSDGSIEVLSTRFSGDGWHEMTFYMDSLKTANRIYGSIEIPDETRGVATLDSMQLIRKRLIPRLYPQRYRQRAYPYFNR